MKTATAHANCQTIHRELLPVRPWYIWIAGVLKHVETHITAPFEVLKHAETRLIPPFEVLKHAETHLTPPFEVLKHADSPHTSIWSIEACCDSPHTSIWNTDTCSDSSYSSIWSIISLEGDWNLGTNWFCALGRLIWFLVFNATFNYIMATSFSGGRSRRTTDHGQATGKLYHLQLRVECTLFL